MYVQYVCMYSMYVLYVCMITYCVVCLGQFRVHVGSVRVQYEELFVAVSSSLVEWDDKNMILYVCMYSTYTELYFKK